MSARQTVECLNAGLLVTGTDIGNVYLVATEGGLALAPVTGGASVPLAEGLGTLVSAGTLVAAFGAIVACSIDVQQVWKAMMDAGAGAEANRLDQLSAAQVATCDTPETCCVDDGAAGSRDASVFRVNRLELPTSDSEGRIQVELANVKTLDTKTGTYVLRDFKAYAFLRRENATTIVADEFEIFSGHAMAADTWTYRYRPGAPALRKLQEGIVRTIATACPREVKTLQLEFERDTSGYSRQRCRFRTQIFGLDRFRP